LSNKNSELVQVNVLFTKQLKERVKERCPLKGEASRLIRDAVKKELDRLDKKEAKVN
jgi:hypothetical protein